MREGAVGRTAFAGSLTVNRLDRFFHSCYKRRRNRDGSLRIKEVHWHKKQGSKDCRSPVNLSAPFDLTLMYQFWYMKAAFLLLLSPVFPIGLRAGGEHLRYTMKLQRESLALGATVGRFPDAGNGRCQLRSRVPVCMYVRMYGGGFCRCIECKAQKVDGVDLVLNGCYVGSRYRG